MAERLDDLAGYEMIKVRHGMMTFRRAFVPHRAVVAVFSGDEVFAHRTRRRRFLLLGNPICVFVGTHGVLGFNEWNRKSVNRIPVHLERTNPAAQPNRDAGGEFHQAATGPE
jgi:hypothetical protein